MGVLKTCAIGLFLEGYFQCVMPISSLKRITIYYYTQELNMLKVPTTNTRNLLLSLLFDVSVHHSYFEPFYIFCFQLTYNEILLLINN